MLTDQGDLGFLSAHWDGPYPLLAGQNEKSLYERYLGSTSVAQVCDVP